MVERLRPLVLSSQQGVKARLLTIEQAAIYLGRTVDGVRGMEKRGTLPSVRLDGRVMFDIKDLDRLIEQNKTERK